MIAFIHEQNQLVVNMDAVSEAIPDGSKCEMVTDGQVEPNEQANNPNGEQNAATDVPEHLREFDVLDEVRGDSGSEAEDRDDDGNV